MTYKDLIKTSICVKLSMVSFSSPKKNLEVFKFIQSIRLHQEFRDIELDKMLQKYGEPTPNKPGTFIIHGQENIDAYNELLDELLQIGIDDIYPLDLTIDDFDNDSCTYPDDKSFWLSANDIDAILKFCSKLKDESETKKG